MNRKPKGILFSDQSAGLDFDSNSVLTHAYVHCVAMKNGEWEGCVAVNLYVFGNLPKSKRRLPYRHVHIFIYRRLLSGPPCLAGVIGKGEGMARDNERANYTQPSWVDGIQ